MEARKTIHLQDLSRGGDAAFEHLFKTYFKGLHGYACTLLRDTHLAEEIVQNVFVRLYEKSARVRIETTLEGYLYRSVYNECLNHRKHEKVRSVYRAHAARQPEQFSPEPGGGTHRALEEKLRKALEELPEHCRTVFQLSRFEGLKYQEIARHLGISVKTVENQMGKALRIMRLRLAEFLTLAGIFLVNLFLNR